MFRFSCLGIWWHHNIWIHEKLKFDYLKNEKSFRSEIKNIFPCFTNAFFRYTKQISKNVADVTFKYEQLISGQGSSFLFSIKSSNNQWVESIHKELVSFGKWEKQKYYEYQIRIQNTFKHLTLQSHHLYSSLKRFGNDRFHVISTWNTGGLFVE